MNRLAATARALVGLLKALPDSRRRQLGGLAALMFAAGLAEMASLGTLVPFLALIAAPADLSAGGRIAGAVYAALDLPQADAVRVITAVFASVAVAAAAVRIALNVALARTNFRIGHDIGSRIYAQALHQPYEYHVRHNSADIVGGIVKVDVAIVVLLAALIGISSSLIALFIIATLLAVNPVVAVVAVSGFGGTYALISRLIHARLLANGRVINAANPARLQVMQEGLGGVRDIILDHTQAYHQRRFDEVDRALRRAQESNQVFGPTPRFLIEAIGMVVIAGVGCWFKLAGGGLDAALPTLGVLVLGGQRLLPLLQQAYQGWVMMVGHLSVIEDVTRLMAPRAGALPPPTEERLPFRRQIRFEDVAFRYADAPSEALAGVTFTIPFGARVGIVGPTGSGKSTLLNLLMGLLEPNAGRIRVDGESIAGERRMAWQNNIAHVPQAIFLADATVLENVAFGIARDRIDAARARDALERAQLGEVIDSLPDGILTVVGENGVRLSGGQRQRLGIARALYKRATVLVLDEATSALDEATEIEVMRSVAALGPEITLVMIAHRVSTLRDCEIRLRVDGGRVVRIAGADAFPVTETEPIAHESE